MNYLRKEQDHNFCIIFFLIACKIISQPEWALIWQSAFKDIIINAIH